MLTISHLSVEYVKVPISGPPNLTSLVVVMAVRPEGQDPESGDWETAAWIGTSASVLIGTGSDIGALTKGAQYGIWVKITSSPEVPVLGPYPLHIT
ncbi:hypothetical protein ACFWYW_55495 [Nonomuraea sp. NPDC059023]|uniref:hypothetical protein n=1 Tax=unclassified Nonomuraea TaxID=2593643 RepID=UPI00368BB659